MRWGLGLYGNLGATVINIVPDLQKRYPWYATDHWNARVPLQTPRSSTASMLETYDYVLYLDSDILVNGDRPERPRQIAMPRRSVCRSARLRFRYRPAQSFAGGRVLIPEERAKSGHYQINSGIIPVSGQFPISAHPA